MLYTAFDLQLRVKIVRSDHDFAFSVDVNWHAKPQQRALLQHQTLLCLYLFVRAAFATALLMYFLCHPWEENGLKCDRLQGGFIKK